MAQSKNLLKGNKVFIKPSNDENLWEEPWDIYINDDEKAKIGQVSFAGEKASGTIPISIAIPDPHHRNRGFGTEALRLMTEWAFYHRNIFEIQTETLHENSAYIMALQKAGFVFRGGTREVEQYSIIKQKSSWTGLYLFIGIIAGLIMGFVLNNTWAGLGIGIFVAVILGSSMDFKEKKYRESIIGKDK
ncbi:MAG: GNAT family N-acetyltransferase [Lachnospiraceae bacterium]|nr:GNAT family N-acetyltransferase [Lachnospiraceae bacterium]